MLKYVIIIISCIIVMLLVIGFMFYPTDDYLDKRLVLTTYLMTSLKDSSIYDIPKSIESKGKYEQYKALQCDIDTKLSRGHFKLIFNTQNDFTSNNWVVALDCDKTEDFILYNDGKFSFIVDLSKYIKKENKCYMLTP